MIILGEKFSQLCRAKLGGFGTFWSLFRTFLVTLIRTIFGFAREEKKRQNWYKQTIPVSINLCFNFVIQMLTRDGHPTPSSAALQPRLHAVNFSSSFFAARVTRLGDFLTVGPSLLWADYFKN
jgi:hypothetical protein